MRILLTSYELTKWAGGELYLTDIAIALHNKGFEVEIFALRKKGQKRTENINGIAVKRFSHPLQLFVALMKEKNAL